MQINSHLLHETKQLASPNHGAKMTPRAVVVHYTAGALPGPAVNTFMNAKSRVSAHLVIDRAGGVTQLVPFNVSAWHAGVSELPGLGSSCNRFSIGIELVNRGFIKEQPSLIEQSDYSSVNGRFWQKYTEAQLAALDRVLQVLWSSYKLEVLTGHEFIAPGRKTDPGPLFPWARYEQYRQYLGAK